jgi:hypothetical protein
MNATHQQSSTIVLQQLSPSSLLFLDGSLPVVVPALGRGVIRLHTTILDREHISEDALLVHRFAEQSASISSRGTQLLTCRLHGLVLALQFKFLLAALLRLEQLPGTVDCPVTQVTIARETERAGGERVIEEVTDES